jgi:hypothetical protein
MVYSEELLQLHVVMDKFGLETVKLNYFVILL